MSRAQRVIIAFRGDTEFPHGTALCFCCGSLSSSQAPWTVASMECEFLPETFQQLVEDEGIKVGKRVVQPKNGSIPRIPFSQSDSRANDPRATSKEFQEVGRSFDNHIKRVF